jgi:hypothetical protein
MAEIAYTFDSELAVLLHLSSNLNFKFINLILLPQIMEGIMVLGGFLLLTSVAGKTGIRFYQ